MFIVRTGGGLGRFQGGEPSVLVRRSDPFYRSTLSLMRAHLSTMCSTSMSMSSTPADLQRRGSPLSCASRSTWSVALAAGLLAMVGCHSYVPVESPAPGTIARVTIPVRAAINVPNGRGGTASVEGVVLSARDTIVLAMRSRGNWGEARETIRIDTIYVPRDQQVRIEVKEFSTGKSVLLGAAIAGAAAAVALTLEIANAEGVAPPEDDPFPPGGTVISVSVASIVAKLFGGG